jgi:Zn-dependent M28 family amino/carboxypeptidase
VIRRAVAAAAILLACGGRAAGDGDRWWAHVRALADDALQGRATGSPGHARAAAYVAGAFERAGLEPAGTRGFLQPVRLASRRIDDARSSVTIVGQNGTRRVTLGEAAYFILRTDPAPRVDAPLVFVGHGLRVPEAGIDDVRGVDLEGAVAVYMAGAPASLSGPLRAHAESAAERWRTLRAAGAIGTIAVASPRPELPWSRMAADRLQPQLSPADPGLDDHEGQHLALVMNPAYAETLFAGSARTFQQLVALDEAGEPLPAFRLAARVSAAAAVERSEIESPNVVGVLRGSDPARRDEYVVVSAHLDHLGVGEAVEGDAIYNGAMDNASGVAAILDVASALQDPDRRPARSLLFLAVTGEEEGQLGSRYFARHPTVPAERIVANINVDMFLPLFPLRTLMVLGLDESDLGADARAAAARLGLAVQPDPEPQRNRFARSDQYSFVRTGIPAVGLKVGYSAGTPEAAIVKKWTDERYHAPSDDLAQPVSLEAAALFVRALREMAERVANRADRPAWNPASFFKRFSR